jgi:SAM-dependent methyltransferase
MLQAIRKHEHERILEIGCGEGSLLRALCASPPWIDASCKNCEWLKTISRKSLRDLIPKGFISPKLLVGVDVDQTPLQVARHHLEQAHELQHNSNLNLRLLHCDFRDLPVQEYEDFDVVVASEVIEHLEDDGLTAFCPKVLGELKPRMVILTTPNYAFNVHFEQAAGGFLDPTGRTKRVFRHHYHKFEWTRKEFATWCDEWASKFGYTVKVEGVGRNERHESDGVGHHANQESALASQTAIFVRKQRIARGTGDRPKIIALGEDLDAMVPLYSWKAQMTRMDDEDIDEFRLVIALERLFEGMPSSEAKQKTLEEIWLDEDVKESCDYRLDFLLAWVSRLSEMEDGEVDESPFHIHVSDGGIVHVCMT